MKDIEEYNAVTPDKSLRLTLRARLELSECRSEHLWVALCCHSMFALDRVGLVVAVDRLLTPVLSVVGYPRRRWFEKYSAPVERVNHSMLTPSLDTCIDHAVTLENFQVVYSAVAVVVEVAAEVVVEHNCCRMVLDLPQHVECVPEQLPAEYSCILDHRAVAFAFDSTPHCSPVVLEAWEAPNRS
jgi:hypothetical protein